MKTKTNDVAAIRVPSNRAIDMSPEAIGRRLARLEQLFQLGLSLRAARRIGPREPPPGESGG